MIAFWESLGALGKTYFVVAGVATAALAIQIVFLIISFLTGGAGDTGGTDIDTDFEADGSSGAGIFTIKGLIALFSIGGWVGLAMEISNVPIGATIPVSVLCGGAALVGIGYLYKSLYKLQSNGNIDINNSIGKTAEVYLTVPAADGGSGKVTVLLQERQVEFEARTNYKKPIKTGSMVKIVGNVDGIVIIEPLHNLSDEKA